MGIGWDLDNTLLNREPAVRTFFLQWLTENATSPLSQEELQQRLETILFLDQGGYCDREAFFAETVRIAGLPESEAGNLRLLFYSDLPKFIGPDGAVIRLLSSLRQKYRMALLTNGGSVFQRAKIRASGMEGLFEPENILISSELGFEKPEPQAFQAVLDRLDCEPDEVLFVGDHAVNDIAGAAAAGMRTCWVSRGRLPKLESPADLVIRDVHSFRETMIDLLLP